MSGRHERAGNGPCSRPPHPDPGCRALQSHRAPVELHGGTGARSGDPAATGSRCGGRRVGDAHPSTGPVDRASVSFTNGIDRSAGLSSAGALRARQRCWPPPRWWSSGRAQHAPLRDPDASGVASGRAFGRSSRSVPRWCGCVRCSSASVNRSCRSHVPTGFRHGWNWMRIECWRSWTAGRTVWLSGRTRVHFSPHLWPRG